MLEVCKMFELKVKNKSGLTLDFTNNPKYTVYNVTGLQPPATLVSTSNNANMDGSSINNIRVNSRNIVVYISLEGNIEANRLELYKYFPLKQTVTLYFKTDNRDVYIEGAVELIECDLFAQRQVVQVSLICAQPYFKGINDIVSYFSEVSSGFEFPFSISNAGIEFSALTPNIRKSIVNVGDVESGLIIEMYAIGTVVNPVVYDVFNRTHIALNFTMSINDHIIINTNMGAKSITLIRDGQTYNIMGYMKADSKWLTLATGDNVFTFAADTGTSNLQITFRSSALYGGV